MRESNSYIEERKESHIARISQDINISDLAKTPHTRRPHETGRSIVKVEKINRNSAHPTPVLRISKDCLSGSSPITKKLEAEPSLKESPRSHSSLFKQLPHP